MSYSFSVRGADKHEVERLAAVEFEKVVTSQPVHDIDRNQARTAIHGFVQMLAKPADDQEIALSVAGSLGYRTDVEGRTHVTSSNVSVSAALMPKGS